MMGSENPSEETYIPSTVQMAPGIPFQEALSQTNDSQMMVLAEIPTNDGDTVSHANSMNEAIVGSNSINSILEPPSYAEAVFQSFDLESTESSDNNKLDRLGMLSQSLTNDYLRISVSDPQTEQELAGGSLVTGGSTYISYLITTFTNLPDFNGTEFNVRRRFRDFVSLSDRLAEMYRGYFIPIRPDKSVVESQMMQKNEFVEQRRILLEKYLRRLAAHPVIRKSKEMREFVEGAGKISGEESPLRRTGMGEVQPGKGGASFFRILKEFKQTISNDWGGVKPPVVEEDREFLEKKEKMQIMEQQLCNVSLQAESLVKAQQDIGETMGQLGLAFVKLTKFDSEETICDMQRVNAEDMKNVATASVKASRLYRDLNSQTVKHLEKLHEYLEVMLAVDNAFSDRASALLTVQTHLSDLASLRLRIKRLEAASSKLFGGDMSRNRRIEELRETVRETEDAKNCAVREYERIKENNKIELERLEKERLDDFLSMLKGFIVNQAGYAEKIANVWETVADQTSKYVK